MNNNKLHILRYYDYRHFVSKHFSWCLIPTTYMFVSTYLIARCKCCLSCVTRCLRLQVTVPSMSRYKAARNNKHFIFRFIFFSFVIIIISRSLVRLTIRYASICMTSDGTWELKHGWFIGKCYGVLRWINKKERSTHSPY